MVFLSLLTLSVSIPPNDDPLDIPTKLKKELDGIRVESGDPQELKDKILKVQQVGHKLKMNQRVEARIRESSKRSFRELKVDPRIPSNNDLGDLEGKISSSIDLEIQKKILELKRESNRHQVRQQKNK